MCMYVDLIGSYVEIPLNCTKVQPSRFQEGLGGGCLDQVLTRKWCFVYVYVCALGRFIC